MTAQTDTIPTDQIMQSISSNDRKDEPIIESDSDKQPQKEGGLVSGLSDSSSSCHELAQEALDALAKKFKTLNENQSRNFYEMGTVLIEAKSQTDKGYGKWGAWLKQVGIVDRTAQAYMRVVRVFPNAQSVADLGIAKAQVLASLPEDDRKSVIEAKHEVKGTPKTVSEMSVNALRDVVRRKKPPKKGNPPPAGSVQIQQDDADAGETTLLGELAHHLSAVKEHAIFLKNFLRSQPMDPGKLADHQADLDSVLNLFQECIDARNSE